MSSNTKRTGRKSLAYIITFSAAYGLPVILHFFITFIHLGLDGHLFGIIAELWLAAIIYSPYYGLYYAALSLIHVVIDLILPPRRKIGYILAALLSTLVSSSLLVAGAISLIVYDLKGFDFGFVALIVGFGWLPVGFIRFIFPDNDEEL